MINLSDRDFVDRDGDRICQMIISKQKRAKWISSVKPEEITRGKDGFGHIGKDLR